MIDSEEISGHTGGGRGQREVLFPWQQPPETSDSEGWGPTDKQEQRSKTRAVVA